MPRSVTLALFQIRTHRKSSDQPWQHRHTPRRVLTTQRLAVSDRTSGKRTPHD